MSDGSHSRCLVIGLDGASPDLIRKFVGNGYLPNIARLMENGIFGILESTFPPMSPSAWTSFMTGKNPGKHGVFDFTQRLTGTYRTYITDRTKESTLWGLLSAYGKKVAIFNVPQTYPVESVNGVMVTGLGTPRGRPFTYPPELGKELLRQGYEVDADVHFRSGDEAGFLKTSIDTARRNMGLILKQLVSIEWDLAMVVLRLTDEVPHFFWKYMDPTHPAYEDRPEFANAILDCYREADTAVGELLKISYGATVIVMSDHGFGPLYKDVYLNEWLRRTGFLTVRSKLRFDAIARRVMQRLGLTRGQIGSLLSKLGLSGLRGMLRSRLGLSATLIPNDARLHLSDVVDWHTTQAYSMGYIGQVYVNLVGREPAGIVQAGEDYERLLNELTTSLLSMPDPIDGLPVVDRVLRRADLYQGSHVNEAADLYLVMREFSYITRESYEWSSSGQYVVSPPTLECADHRPEGVLIVSGPFAAAHSIELSGAKIIDLTPTILHLMGLPVQTDMDGRVLSEWLDIQKMDRSITYDKRLIVDERTDADEMSSEDEKDILDRLKRLGYVE
jgi:predicted AlkP superfamily phosphohydrolase/phosphomutase